MRKQVIQEQSSGSYPSVLTGTGNSGYSVGHPESFGRCELDGHQCKDEVGGGLSGRTEKTGDHRFQEGDKNVRMAPLREGRSSRRTATGLRTSHGPM